MLRGPSVRWVPAARRHPLSATRHHAGKEPTLTLNHPGNTGEDRYVYGQVAIQTVVTIDGLGTATRTDSVCDYMIDIRTNQLVQIGGEGEIAADKIDFIAQMLALSPEEVQRLGDGGEGHDHV